MLKLTIDPIGVDGNGNSVSYIQSEMNKDPINFNLKLVAFVKATKGLTDFSKITNIVKSNTTSEIASDILRITDKDKNEVGLQTTWTSFCPSFF